MLPRSSCGTGGTRCGEGESNLVRFGVLSGGQTSLITADTKPPLPAGTYYVHIAGHDAVHNGCPQIEFSDIVEVTIGADGTETRPGSSPQGPASAR